MRQFAPLPVAALFSTAALPKTAVLPSGAESFPQKQGFPPRVYHPRTPRGKAYLPRSFHPVSIASGAGQAYNKIYRRAPQALYCSPARREFLSIYRYMSIAIPFCKIGPNFHAGPGGSRGMRKKDFTDRIRVFHVESVENSVETVKNVPVFPKRIISTGFCAAGASTNC